MANSDFSKVIEFEPSNAEIYHKRAIIHYKLGNQQYALLDINKAIELGYEVDNDFIENLDAVTDQGVYKHSSNYRRLISKIQFLREVTICKK